MRKLSSSPTIDTLVRGLVRGLTLASTLAATVIPVPASGQDIGDECAPGSPAPRPGITCQATGEYTYHEPYLLNARKGDALISVGCGQVGAMLRQLPDKQQYDHAGIMVEDRVLLRHSTAAEDRFEENGSSDGADPDTLQYGWPGTITQSVYQAFEGQWDYHPDDGTPYRLGIFNDRPAICDGDAAATFPSVVKPPFDQEQMLLPNSAETVRDGLERAADAALSIEGHYRLFGYTEADLIGRLQGPGRRLGPSPVWAWAEGRLDGTMCSQLVWSAARAAALPLEDPAVVEEGDKGHAGSPTLDGLYEYTEEERRAAARWVYDKVYETVAEEVPLCIFDACDNTASQIVNCFAFDWCGEEEGVEYDGTSHPKDSDRWDDPGPGIGVTVSPEDITHWDLPTAGGVYGMTEPMRYRMGSYRPRHRWARSAGTGDLQVSVQFEGNGVENVPVTLDGFAPQTTDADGLTTFVAIPAGTYFLEAITDLDADGDGNVEEVHASTNFTINAGGRPSVILVLTPFPTQPSNVTEHHRRINLNGNIFVRDEDWPDADETANCPISGSHVIDPVIQRSHRFEFTCCADEVRGEVSITATLDSSSREVTARVTATLFEGGDCNTDDEEEEESDARDIDYDESATLTVTAADGDWTDDDAVRVQVRIDNERNTAP